MDNQSSLPILFIVHRRDKLMKYYLDLFKSYNGEIFVYQDGTSNKLNDIFHKKVKKKLNYLSKKNIIKFNSSIIQHGSKDGPKTAISWFFEHVEIGIIIEDDVIIDYKFIFFCNQYSHLLNDSSIAQLTAVSKSKNIKPYLTRFSHIWGWCTTRNNWNCYNEYSFLNIEKNLNNYDIKLQMYLTSVIDYIIKKNNAWDYHWFCTNLSLKKYTLSPTIQLSENVGFDEYANHTKTTFKNKSDKISNLIPDLNNYKISDFECNDNDDNIFFGYNQLNCSYDPTFIRQLQLFKISFINYIQNIKQNKTMFKLIKFAKKIFRKIFPTNRIKALDNYYMLGGDEKYRYNYNLNENSIVYDLGGFQGQWTSDIYSRYNSRIKIFEPVEIFCEKIKSRFIFNNKIEVFQFGLSSKTCFENISLLEEGSSIYRKSKSTERINFIDIKEWFEKHPLDLEMNIDLIKINIEGGEYDLMNRLIELDYIKYFRNIQIQFHNISVNSRLEMNIIQTKLSETHVCNYSFDFVWENWERK
jgi:FkbM family methyltransferase